jgi:hypothetical protein
MSKLTELASAHITETDMITVILSEPDDMPSSVIVHWPLKPTVLRPHRFGDAAALIVRSFSAAHVKLAHIKARRR